MQSVFFALFAINLLVLSFYDLKYKLEGYEMALNDLNDAILNYINISKSHYILETATLNDVDDAYDNYISYLSNLFAFYKDSSST